MKLTFKNDNGRMGTSAASISYEKEKGGTLKKTVLPSMKSTAAAEEAPVSVKAAGGGAAVGSGGTGAPPTREESRTAVKTGKRPTVRIIQGMDWTDQEAAGKALQDWGSRAEQLGALNDARGAELKRRAEELENLGKRINELEKDPRTMTDPTRYETYKSAVDQYNRFLPEVQAARSRYERTLGDYRSAAALYSNARKAWQDAMPQEQKEALGKLEGYRALAEEADFGEKSRYRTTANGKERFNSFTGTYTDTGFDDPIYDLINGNETARGHQLVNDAKNNTTHEHLEGLPEETVRTFNYLYATKGQEAAYEYIDLVTDKKYTGIGTMALGVLEGTGLASLSAAAGGLLGTEESKERNREWYTALKQDAAAAREQHPAMYNTGSVGGTLALMYGTGAALGAAEGALAAGVKIGGKTVALQMAPMVQGAVNSSLTWLTRDAVQNAGSAATGLMSGKDYLKSMGISGLQGAAGGLAGGLVGSGMAGILRKKGMMTPFMEFVRQTTSGFSAASASIGTGYALRGEKPEKEQLAADLATAFLFSVLQSGISAYASTQSARARMEAALNRTQEEYSVLSRGAANMTPEARAAQAERIIAQTRSLRESLNSRYMAGQQAAVNDMNQALDAIEEGLQGYVNGFQAAQASAAPAGSALGAGAAASDQETESLAVQLQEALEKGLSRDAGDAGSASGGAMAAGSAAGDHLPEARKTVQGPESAGTASGADAEGPVSASKVPEAMGQGEARTARREAETGASGGWKLEELDALELPAALRRLVTGASSGQAGAVQTARGETVQNGGIQNGEEQRAGGIVPAGAAEGKADGAAERTGTPLPAGASGRDAGRRLGGRTPRVPEAVRTRGASREHRELIQKRRAAAEDAPVITPEEAGAPRGAENGQVQILPEADWDEEIRQGVTWAMERGVREVKVLLGPIGLEENGRTCTVAGVIDPESGTIFIQADHKKQSFSETLEHETAHMMSGTEEVRSFMEAVKSRYKESAWGRLEQAYRSAYSELTGDFAGMSEEEIALYIWEEILADAYAETNKFGTRASVYGGEAEAVFAGQYGLAPTRESGAAEPKAPGRETAQATERTTGPPRYSAEEPIDSEALETAERLEMQGVRPEEILEITGLERDDGGQWRRTEALDGGTGRGYDGGITRSRGGLRDGEEQIAASERVPGSVVRKETGGTGTLDAGVRGQGAGGHGGVQEKSGQHPGVPGWASGHLTEEAKTEDSAKAVACAKRYAPVVHMVEDSAIRAQNPGALALTDGGVVYLSDSISKGFGDVIGYHEAVHAAKQRRDLEYLKFLDRTNDCIEFSGVQARRIVGLVTQMRFQGRDYIDLSNGEKKTVLDELNATVWGYHKQDPENARNQFAGVFLDYDGYIRELDAIMEAAAPIREPEWLSLPGAEESVSHMREVPQDGAGQLRSEEQRGGVQHLPEVPEETLELRGVQDAGRQAGGASGGDLQVLRGVGLRDLPEAEGGAVQHGVRPVSEVDLRAEAGAEGRGDLSGVREEDGGLSLPGVSSLAGKGSGSKDGAPGSSHPTDAREEDGGLRLPGDGEGDSSGVREEDGGLSLPEPEKLKPRFSAEDKEDQSAELAAVNREILRLRDMDYQVGLLRNGGAEAIAENEKRIRTLERRAERLRDAEAARQREREQKKERAKAREKERQAKPEAKAAGEKAAPKEKKPVKPVKPAAKSRPIIAKEDLRKDLMNIFSIPEGRKADLWARLEPFADRLLRDGALTEEDRSAFFDLLYQSGEMTRAADDYIKEGRETIAGGHIYVNDFIRGDFGEDWNLFRKRAFGANVYLTNNRNDRGVDQWNEELADLLPGLFDREETDGRTVLERIVEIAEEGRDQRVSLAEYTRELAGEEYITEREFLDGMERQLDWALRTFAEKADLEVKLRDRTGVRIARERERFAETDRKRREREDRRRAEEKRKRRELMAKQREDRELRDRQKKTLNQLRWLSRNANKAPKDLKARIQETLGDIDLYAVSAANEMNWSKKYQATWRDLVEMFEAKTDEHGPEYDPNFLPTKDLEEIVARIRKRKLEDLDIGALQDLYKAAVGLRTEYYNRNNLLNDEEHRMFAGLYADVKEEIESAPSGFTGKGIDQWLNLGHLTPMNVFERMGGWNPEGAFYSMAKQLEKGERDARAYTVEAKRQIEGFLREHPDWVKTADGQGRGAVWYEMEFPAGVVRGMGDRLDPKDTVKVYMTPSMKVQLYLESKNTDNLRHIAGGRTFPDRELYSKGKRQEAFVQGTVVRLEPKNVLSIVSELTDEERELAELLEKYYNGFAAERINKVSNHLLGYDKAITKNYAPIFTDRNYNHIEPGVFDLTAEGVPHMKGRIQFSETPSYNISAFDAFEQHVDQTSRFVGYSIPVHNVNRLMNWQDGDISTRKVIGGKWGGEAVKYIENLVKELQGGRIRERDALNSLTDTLLSRYIASVFGFNPSIVLKQAMSFPLAGAYLGWENLPNAAEALKTEDSLINTYTSELAYRLMGYATPETAHLKNNPSKLEENRFLRFTFGGGAITAMDGWTVKTMWRWAENAVRRDRPDLEAGTEEQIRAGQSPFYLETARRFEEAVSRSQPMYDVMHRADVMRNGNGITRTLTLFKTVPIQQYNMLRQLAAEAEYYQRERKKGRASKEKAEQAKRRYGRAVQGVILATLGIGVINFLNNLLTTGGKSYRDEEGDLTLESAGKTFLVDFLKSSTGMIAGADVIAGLVGSKLTGGRWNGIETPGISQLQELLEELYGAGETVFQLIWNCVALSKDGGDPMEYLRRHGADYLGALEEITRTAAKYIGGLPADNIRKYALGALRWMAPEIKTAYEDAMKTADKSGLKGLTGEALEQRIEDILKNRAGDEALDAAAALAELYEAGYKDAVPGDTPEEISVDGEARKLNLVQSQLYDRVWRDTVGRVLEDVAGSRTFQDAEPETRAAMLKALYSYAGELARAEVFEDYELPDSAEKLREILGTGLDTADCLELKAAGAMDRYLKAVKQGQKPEDAAMAALAVTGIREEARERKEKTGEKTGNLALYREALNSVRGTKDQMAALALLMGEGEYAKLEAGVEHGISPEEYVTAREAVAEIDTNGRVSQEEAARAIGSMPGLSDRERAVLWQIQNAGWKPEGNPFDRRAGREVYRALQEEKEKEK